MMTRVVSQVAGRAFVGAPLNRNEQWIKTSIGYTRDIFEAAAQLRKWHPLLRPVMKYRVPAIWRIYKDNSITEQLLTPIIKELEQQEKNEGKVTQNDAIAWVRDALSPAEKQDYAFQAINALGYGAASIHTTSKQHWVFVHGLPHHFSFRLMYSILLRTLSKEEKRLQNLLDWDNTDSPMLIGQLVTNSIFDLVARPQYIKILRQEAKEVLAESGGEWKLEGMAKLKKMGKFMMVALLLHLYSPNILEPLNISCRL
jgi:hypothetical protein